MEEARLFGGEQVLGRAKSSEIESPTSGKVSKRVVELLLLLSKSVLKKCAWPRMSVSVASGTEKDGDEVAKSSSSLVSG